MSTKMLRQIIEAHRALGPEVRGTHERDLNLALDEVAAIEKAAAVLKDVPVFLNTPSLMEKADAYDLMERIATQRNGGTTGAVPAGASGVHE